MTPDLTPCPVQMSRDQLAATVKMGLAMAVADGVVVPEEHDYLAYELSRFGLTTAEVTPLIDRAADMDTDTAIRHITAMPDDAKTYVAAFLGTMMAIDREVDTTELALWQHTCRLCHLPEMTLAQALDYMRES